MFEKEIEVIQKYGVDFFGQGKWIFFIMIGFLFLLITEKKKENRNLLVYYPILVLIIILNPIFAKCMLNVLSTNIYYRFFWLLPIGIGIAYFGTVIVCKSDNKWLKNGLACLFCIMIMYSGILVYSSVTFEKVDNWYKLSDECVEIVEIINRIPNCADKKVMTSIETIGSIRQLDASIKLAYTRRVYGNYSVYPVVKYYYNGEVKKVAKICKKEKTNIIVWDKAVYQECPFEKYGYKLYDETEHHMIYVLDMNCVN